MPTRTQNRKPAKPRRPRPNVATVRRNCDEIFSGYANASLVEALQQWLPSRRWFRGKARGIKSVGIEDRIEAKVAGEKAFLLLFKVNYNDGGDEVYVLPLGCAFGRKAAEVTTKWPQAIVARISLERPTRKGVLYDAIVSREFCHALLELISRSRKVRGQAGELEAEPEEILRRMRREGGLNMEPKVSKAEQSNSSIIYDGALMLKFFRRLDCGINPELEIERFLSEHAFQHSPPLAGALEYHEAGGATSTLAVMTSFIPGCHDAWEDTQLALRGFYRRVMGLPAKLREFPPAMAMESFFGGAALPGMPVGLVGSYFEDAKVLGRRTADLHLALASDESTPAFKPEPWTPEAQKSLFDSLKGMTHHNFETLRKHQASLPAHCHALAQSALSLEPLILRRFHALVERPVEAVRIRTHGDYHLGQVLHHGKSFLIIDFEGEPALPLETRRIKQSALRDVAGMIHSFFYAARVAWRNRPRVGRWQPDAETKAAWARYWAVWVSSTFLRSYLETAKGAPFIPTNETGLKALLDAELLRKAIYELGYELNNRPDWTEIGLQVLLDLLNPDNPL